MIDMFVPVIMLIIWFYVGAYNMVIPEKISRLAFFCCWITLLIYIIATLII